MSMNSMLRMCDMLDMFDMFDMFDRYDRYDTYSMYSRYRTMSGSRKRIYDLAFEDSDSESDSDSDSEEELVVRRPRLIKESENHFITLGDEEFVMRYRLTKSNVNAVLLAIKNQLELGNDQNVSISPMNQLLCTLRFYATGCFNITDEDVYGVNSSSAHSILIRVSIAIAKLLHQYVKFPKSADEIEESRQGFFRIAKFPKVVGAIDCTHIKYINSPGGEKIEIYRNRKNYFSLNVQGICNSKLEFTDIVARWSGRAPDSHIFSCCRRKAMFDKGIYGDSVLLGDSAYSCQSHVMTPLPSEQVHNEAEQCYNESHMRTRNVIERVFVAWKTRFPAMALGLQVSVHDSFPIIVATVVLHNIAQRAGEDVPPVDPNLKLASPWEVILSEGEMGDVENLPPSNIRQPRRRRRRENPIQRKRREFIENNFAR